MLKTIKGMNFLTKQIQSDMNFGYIYFGKKNRWEKLDEEVKEFLSAKNNSERIEELCDILIVGIGILLNEAIVQKFFWKKLERFMSRTREGFYDADRSDKQEQEKDAV